MPTARIERVRAVSVNRNNVGGVKPDCEVVAHTAQSRIVADTLFITLGKQSLAIRVGQLVEFTSHSLALQCGSVAVL